MSFNKKRILGWIALTSLLLLPSQSLAAGKTFYVPLSYENGTSPGIYQVDPNTKRTTLIIKDNTYKLAEVKQPVVKLNVNEDNRHYKLGRVTTSKEALENPYEDYTQFTDPMAIGEELLFQKYLGGTEHAGWCGGASADFNLLYKKDTNGKEILLTKDTIANATGSAVQVNDSTIFYTKVNKDFLGKYSLYKMDANGNNKVELAKSIDDYILSDTNEIIYLKDSKLYKMDINGKKSTQIKSIKDPIHGMLSCDEANYKFTNSGIYYENDDGQTFVYDFSSGKIVEVTNYNMYYLTDHSKNLQEFAVIDYDWETNTLIGAYIVDKNGSMIKNLNVPTDAKSVKIDMTSGTVSYFVKTTYFEKKY